MKLPLTHIDLFSGIGGFALSCQWAGIETEVFCEQDKFCQQILKKHWPGVPIIDDIREFDGSAYTNAFILTGGVPCQPASCAGKQRGTADDRWLWPEAFRVVREARPRWCLFENVRGLLSLEGGMVFDNLLSELEAIGYEVWSFVIPACAVNAPHRRDRVWIVANRTEQGGQQIRRRSEVEGKSSNQPTQQDSDVADTPDSRAEGLREREDAVFQDAPHTPKRQDNDRESRIMGTAPERWESGNPAVGIGNQYAADTSRQRLQRGERTGTHEKRQAPHGSATECHNAWHEPWIEAATRTCVRPLDDGVSGKLARPKGWRVNALKAVGNAIVPQVAFEIIKAILQAENQQQEKEA